MTLEERQEASERRILALSFALANLSEMVSDLAVVVRELVLSNQSTLPPAEYVPTRRH
jgi:hypothetical protein